MFVSLLLSSSFFCCLGWQQKQTTSPVTTPASVAYLEVTSLLSLLVCVCICMHVAVQLLVLSDSVVCFCQMFKCLTNQIFSSSLQVQSHTTLYSSHTLSQGFIIRETSHYPLILDPIPHSHLRHFYQSWVCPVLLPPSHLVSVLLLQMVICRGLLSLIPILRGP